MELEHEGLVKDWRKRCAASLWSPCTASLAAAPAAPRQLSRSCPAAALAWQPISCPAADSDAALLLFADVALAAAARSPAGCPSVSSSPTPRASPPWAWTSRRHPSASAPPPPTSSSPLSSSSRRHHPAVPMTAPPPPPPPPLRQLQRLRTARPHHRRPSRRPRSASRPARRRWARAAASASVSRSISPRRPPTPGGGCVPSVSSRA